MYPFGPGEPMSSEHQAPEVEEMSDVDQVMHDPVLRHRAASLASAGLNPFQARSLALDRRVDVHWVTDRLVARGCPPDIAFDIASH